MAEINPTDRWDDAVAKLGLVTAEDIVFGHDVTPARAQTAVRDIPTLRKYFNDYADNCHWAKINSEGQAYQDYNVGNHVFGPDHLGLVASLDPGHTAQPRPYCTADARQIAINTSWPCTQRTPLAAFPGSQPEPNSLVMLAYAGTYLVADANAEGVMLFPWFGSAQRVPGYCDSAAFLPVAAAWVSAQSDNILTINTRLPSFVRSGMFCGVAGNGAGDITWNYPATVREISGNQITLDHVPPGALHSWVVFMPPIRSAQVWRRHYPGVGFDGVTAMALRAVITIPDSKGGRNNFNAHNPPPAGAPMGCWPGVWFYSGTSIPNVQFDWSEIDVVEYWLSKTQWFGQQSSNTHGPWTESQGGMGATNVYLAPFCAPGSNPWMCNLPEDISGKPISVGLIQTEDMVYFYLNDVLWRSARFKWTSKQPPQLCINQAWGSLKGPYGANLQWPFDDSAFPCTFKIHRATQLLRK